MGVTGSRAKRTLLLAGPTLLLWLFAGLPAFAQSVCYTFRSCVDGSDRVHVDGAGARDGTNGEKRPRNALTGGFRLGAPAPICPR